ncbi:MAG: arylamine N-acetyltransferase [Clostridia bacterium]|nr:arylamine N-acetyltransferase [Clostridia bacterium]
MLTEKQRDLYLKRIGYTGDGRPCLRTLADLQKAHLVSVPYETLDLVRGVPVSLDPEDIFEKIVVRGRGGYCFELNELYVGLLESLSFRVTRRFSRFLKGETGLPKPRHLLPVVSLPDGDYLSDVGVAFFSPMQPIRLSEGLQRTERGDWEIRTDPVLGKTMYQVLEDSLLPVLTIPEEIAFPVDFTAIHYFCCTSPDSHFLSHPILGLRTENGHAMYRCGVLTLEENGVSRKIEIRDDVAFKRMLLEVFHLPEKEI